MAPGLPGTEMPYSVSVPMTRHTLMRSEPTRAVPGSAAVNGGTRGAGCDRRPSPGTWSGRPRGRSMRRDNLPHLVVAVLVRDPAGRIYVHRRTDTKDVFPGMHDCFAAGCVQAGEESGRGSPAGARRGARRGRGRRSRPLTTVLVRGRGRPGTSGTAFLTTYDGESPTRPRRSPGAPG